MSRRRLAAFALVIAVLAPVGPQVRADAPRRSTFIVQFAPGFRSQGLAADVARAYGGGTSYVYDSAIQGFAFRGTKAAADRLAADPRIASVEPDQAVSVADVPSNVTHQRRTAARRAFYAGFDGAGETIAMLDTGVNPSHEVFQAHSSIRAGAGCTGDGWHDQEGHGTAGASQAVGRLGVAHRAKVLPVKVFPGNSLGTTMSALICGLDWVRRNYQAKGIRIVNMSLATGHAESLRNAVNALLSRGVVVVAAVGNNFGGPAGYPAAYPGVIRVSALGSGNDIAYFSASGGIITAPGTNVYSAENDSNSAYSTRTGTSRAAPQVAGAAAIVFGEGRNGGILAALRISGRCPNGQVNGVNNYCSGTGWQNDPGATEPLIDAYCAGIYASSTKIDIPRCGF